LIEDDGGGRMERIELGLVEDVEGRESGMVDGSDAWVCPIDMSTRLRGTNADGTLTTQPSLPFN
jgi:hypothetical protein